MRYKPQHKQETRGRIVNAAGRLFRAHGYEATGVDAIMAEAGLTPGAFYAHFPSKQALLVETLSQRLGESAARVSKAGGKNGAGLAALVGRYLCVGHRDDPAAGCPIPSLAAEVSRLALGTRREFGKAMTEYLASVEAFMPGASRAKRRERALVTVSTLVGAMTMARAVGDKALSEEVLEAARHALLDTPEIRASPAGATRKKRRRS